MITTLNVLDERDNEFLLTLYNNTSSIVSVDINGTYGFKLAEYLEWSSLERAKYDTDLSGNYFEFDFSLNTPEFIMPSIRFVGSRDTRTHSRILKPGESLSCVMDLSLLYIIGADMPNKARIRYRRIFPQLDGPALGCESNWVEIETHKLQRLALPTLPAGFSPLLPPIPPSLVRRALTPQLPAEQKDDSSTDPGFVTELVVEQPNTKVKDLIQHTASGALLTELLDPDAFQKPVPEKVELAEPQGSQEMFNQPSQSDVSTQQETTSDSISPHHVYASEQKRLQERIGVWMYHTMHDACEKNGYEATRIELFFGSVGEKMRAGVRLITPQGRLKDEGKDRFEIIGTPDSTIMNNIRTLKKIMYRRGKGTWYEAHITVSSDGEFSATFNYNSIPQWGDYFETEDYQLDQNTYPRTDPYQPDWLKEKLAVDIAEAPSITA